MYSPRHEHFRTLSHIFLSFSFQEEIGKFLINFILGSNCSLRITVDIVDKVVISLFWFVWPIITQKPFEQFAWSFDLGSRQKQDKPLHWNLRFISSTEPSLNQLKQAVQYTLHTDFIRQNGILRPLEAQY